MFGYEGFNPLQVSRLRNTAQLNLKSQVMKFSVCVCVDICICAYTVIHTHTNKVIILLICLKMDVAGN